jgi:hypothetical protein
MSDVGPSGTAFYRATEVARMLRCSEWWIKEQARRRRIPYSWIGGSYLFTEAHVAEIVRLFEVQPVETATSAPRTGCAPVSGTNTNTGSATRLVARVPRRTRAARSNEAA